MILDFRNIVFFFGHPRVFGPKISFKKNKLMSLLKLEKIRKKLMLSVEALNNHIITMFSCVL